VELIPVKASIIVVESERPVRKPISTLVRITKTGSLHSSPWRAMTTPALRSRPRMNRARAPAVRFRTPSHSGPVMKRPAAVPDACTRARAGPVFAGLVGGRAGGVLADGSRAQPSSGVAHVTMLARRGRRRMEGFPKH
jgi:hypothetical protein